MQKSWHLDEDKLTFIIQEVPANAQPGTDAQLQGRMLGDVNLFLSKEHTDEDSGEDQPQGSGRLTAEAEVMIAEPDARRSGIAFNALRLLFLYASTHLDLPPASFFCKIGAKNDRSRALFQKLGFHQVAFSDIWQEAQLQARPEARAEIWERGLSLQELQVHRDPLSQAQQ